MALITTFVVQVEAVSIHAAIIAAAEKLGYVGAIVETGGGRDGLRAFIAYKDVQQMVREIRGR